MARLPRALILLFTFTLPLLSSGCGFTPLYADLGEDQALQQQLSNIAIANITEPTTTGFLFQRELEKRIGGGAAPDYDLTVRLKESRQSIAVTGEANTNRFSYELKASYQLVHRQSGKKMAGEVSSTTGYGIVPSQYSSLVGEEEARNKSIIDVANQMEVDIALALRGF